MIFEPRVMVAASHRRIFGNRVFINVLGDNREQHVPGIRRERFLVEEHDRVIVVGFDPFELVRSGANGEDRHGRGHDYFERESDIVRSNRLAVGPGEVVANHNLVHQVVFAAFARRRPTPKGKRNPCFDRTRRIRRRSGC